MRKLMRKSLFLASLIVSASLIGSIDRALGAPSDRPSDTPSEGVPDIARAERPLVQIALLLDTSNSMDGLINQARTQLWTIVNEISKAKREGQTPRLEVALIEYGNDKLSAGEGFIRMVLPFTDNLDDVSEKLFALTTNGGSEFCGQAIAQASDTLKWSGDRGTYKAIFIAGNEPFGQGTVDYKDSISSALGRGVVVNTIHCGPRGVGVEGGWADGAKRGEGAFTNIDQNREIIFRRCTQDDEIERLSVEINVTYVPYGTRGKESSVRQSVQDQNAVANAPSGASVQRAASKAGANYDNTTWDLVDAVANKTVDLAKIDAADLPESMRKMSVTERQDYITSQAQKRDAIRKQINTLIVEREKERAAAPATQPAGEATLDAAIVQSVREQLEARKYEVAK